MRRNAPCGDRCHYPLHSVYCYGFWIQNDQNWSHVLCFISIMYTHVFHFAVQTENSMWKVWSQGLRVIHVESRLYLGLGARKPVLGGLRTTKAQTSLRIRAVWSAPLLSAFWKVPYLSLLHAKFHFSSFFLASLCSWWDELSLALSETPKTGFIASRPIHLTRFVCVDAICPSQHFSVMSGRGLTWYGCGQNGSLEAGKPALHVYMVTMPSSIRRLSIFFISIRNKKEYYTLHN